MHETHYFLKLLASQYKYKASIGLLMSVDNMILPQGLPPC